MEQARTQLQTIFNQLNREKSLLSVTFNTGQGKHSNDRFPHIRYEILGQAIQETFHEENDPNNSWHLKIYPPEARGRKTNI